MWYMWEIEWKKCVAVDKTWVSGYNIPCLLPIFINQSCYVPRDYVLVIAYEHIVIQIKMKYLMYQIL